MDFSSDHVARVQAAKAAAQHEMESFGEPSEYNVAILQGKLTEQSVIPSQQPLNFESLPGETD